MSHFSRKDGLKNDDFLKTFEMNTSIRKGAAHGDVNECANAF